MLKQFIQRELFTKAYSCFSKGRGRSESNTVIFHSNPPPSRGILKRCWKQMVTGSNPARSLGNLYCSPPPRGPEVWPQAAAPQDMPHWTCWWGVQLGATMTMNPAAKTISGRKWQLLQLSQLLEYSTAFELCGVRQTWGSRWTHALDSKHASEALFENGRRSCPRECGLLWEKVCAKPSWQANSQ